MAAPGGLVRVRVLDVTAMGGGVGAAAMGAAEMAAASEHAALLAHAAHELRAPLVGVAGLLSCVGLEGLEPMTADAIVTSAARVESLLQLLSDMLDTRLSREGALPVSLRAHSWHEVLAVVEDVAKLFSLPAADAGHSMTVDAALAPAVTAAAVRLDLARLAQVRACVCVYFVRACFLAQFAFFARVCEWTSVRRAHV